MLELRRFIIVVFVTGCACWQAVNKDNPQCVDLRKAIDCTSKIATQIPDLYLTVKTLFESGRNEEDIVKMLSSIEGVGVSAIACTALRVKMDEQAKVESISAAPSAGAEMLKLRAKASSGVRASARYIEVRGFKFSHPPAPVAQAEEK